MADSINRVQFLRGRFGRGNAPRRPPWSIPEESFTEKCDRCGDCITACPERLLEKGRGGFPQLSFKRGECTFCEDCLKACSTPALHRSQGENGEPFPPWVANITLESHCLAFKGVECRICGEQCDTEAIRFRLVVGGSAMPELDQQACNGCGACYAPCPVNAVTVTVTPIN